MDDREHGFDALSVRQRDCLLLAAEGLTSKEIARRLGVSPSTVDNHIRAATGRLQASGRREAIRILRNGNREGLANADRIDAAPDAGGWPSLPPLGGRPNLLSPRRRYYHIAQIALFATMVLAAITVTIAGLVHLFTR